MNWEMIGTISIPKETDKFKPFEVRTFDSGYARKRLMLNITCGDSRHMVQIENLYKSDGSGVVYTMTKGGRDDNGNTIKGEVIQIPFKERKTSKRLPEVADFRKFVFDTEVHGRRRALEQAAEHMKNGQALTDQELRACGVEDESEIDAALKESQAKHLEFISEYDFIDTIKAAVESGKYKDTLFYIRGQQTSNYSEEKKRFYDTLIPQRIYIADQSATPYAQGAMNFLFGADSLDDASVEEKGRYYINGWEMVRDNNRKANIPHPVTIALDVNMKNDKGTPVATGWKRKFTAEDEQIKEYGVVFDMINGAQRREINIDDLDPDVQEDIMLGLVTLEEIQRDLGGSVYGDRVQEYLFVKPSRGWTAKRPEVTAFGPDDMEVKPIDLGLDGLFEDDDDDI